MHTQSEAESQRNGLMSMAMIQSRLGQHKLKPKTTGLTKTKSTLSNFGSIFKKNKPKYNISPIDQ